ncbi:MAG: bifunctional glycosyltransferase/CDP-glycerol:glycerophosphate glycerophosphotransferase [Mycoplasmatales bacterium]
MQLIEKLKRHDYKMYLDYAQARIRKTNKLHKFIIITAVYNTSSYLDKYFSSLVSVNYDLENLKIIVVDDGSTDDSQLILRKWQMKYPELIILQTQVNLGQAIARNNGLDYMNKKLQNYDFVTFIDSDDYVDSNYFVEVNKAINYYSFVSIFTTRWKFIDESTGTVNYNHPLDYRFRNRLKYTLKDLIKSPTYFNLSMSSSFFKVSALGNLKLRNIKPQFEDAYFLNEYLLKNNDYQIVYINSTNYNYVKRKAADSTLNKAKLNPEKYVSLLEMAYLNLLRQAKQIHSFVPDFIQNLILYDLSWNIKELSLFEVPLSELQFKIRRGNLEKIFKLINRRNLEKNHNYYWNYFQIGLEHRYYPTEEVTKIALYQNFHLETTTQYLLHTATLNFQIIIDNQEFKDYWLTCESLDQEFFIYRILFTVPTAAKVQVVVEERSYFPEKINRRAIVKLTTNSICLFFDRVAKADDNAEALYHEFSRKYPNSYFVIEEKCSDYNRLKALGFKLISYGSKEFEQKYFEADFIFSSSVDPEIENYKFLRHNTSNIKARFIFLQHGVITDNLGNWLARKKIDQIVISAPLEEQICLTTLPFSQNQYLRAGLPRFDRLKKNGSNSKTSNKTILIHFTWRKNLKNKEIEQTSYASELVNVIEKAEVYGEKVIVVLHPQAASLKTYLQSQTSSEILNAVDIIYREVFQKADILITDYSSVFADMVYLEKKVIFFQTNPKEFYVNHLYSQAIDYKTEAPGIVASSIDELINALKEENRNKVDFYFTHEEKQTNCQMLIKLIENKYK